MRGMDFEQEIPWAIFKSLERKFNRTESHLRNLDMRVTFIPYLFLGKGLAAYWVVSFYVLCKLLKHVGFTAWRCQVPHVRFWHIVAIFCEIPDREIKHSLSMWYFSWHKRRTMLLVVPSKKKVLFQFKKPSLGSPKNLCSSTPTHIDSTDGICKLSAGRLIVIKAI